VIICLDGIKCCDENKSWIVNLSKRMYACSVECGVWKRGVLPLVRLVAMSYGGVWCVKGVKVFIHLKRWN
jgi:hypothetical protein